jgi:membrane-associated phospholipid phosphatase
LKKIKLLQPIDILIIIYGILNIVYILLGIILHGASSPRMHDPLKHLAIFSGIIVFVIILKSIYRKHPAGFWEVFKDWYIILFFVYFFETTSALNTIIFPEFLDEFFLKIDQSIFGYQPAVEWGKRLDNWLVSEILHLAYFSYYISGFFFLAVYLKNRSRFRLYAFNLAFVFFLCYFTYNILPVVGGRYLPGMMELTQTYRYGLFTRIMAFIYNHTPHLGGAFPSSHVAIAIVVNLCAFDYNKKAGWVILPVVILLTISTVYCHYHYFIDTVFGIIYGIAFYYLGKKIYLSSQKNTKESHV